MLLQVYHGDSLTGGVKEVVFNESKLTTASFFNGIGGSSGVNEFAAKIGTYYGYIRNLAIAVLLFVLLYVGVRMAISTIAEKEAKYKKMLQNWAISLALVFLLHYIIILTFAVNDSLVDTLNKFVENNTTQTPLWLSKVELVTQGVIPIAGWPYVIVYAILTFITVAFLFNYIKRVIVLGFLIVISPLISITYAIDKVSDGKSQTLNTWLNEFVYSVLIQPFHCVIYIVFVQTSLETLSWGNGGIANAIFAMASMLFMMKAEGIVKKIFGIRADSVGDAAKTGVAALSMATGFLGNFKEDKGKKMPEMKSNSSKTKTKPAQDGNGGNGAGTGNGEGANSDQGNSAGNAAGSQNENNGGNDSGSADEGQAQDTNPDESMDDINPDDNSPEDEQEDKKQNAIQKALDAAKSDIFNKKTLLGPTSSFFERYSGEKGAKGIAKGMAKFALKSGVAMTAAIGASGLGDPDKGMQTYTSVRKSMDNAEGFFEKGKREEQAEKNEQTFAGAYQDFATEYRNRNGQNASDEEIGLAIEDLLEKDGTEIQTEYERDMYNQARQLQETGEALGYDDSSSYVRDVIRKVHNGEVRPDEDYLPKNYNQPQADGNKGKSKKSKSSGKGGSTGSGS